MRQKHTEHSFTGAFDIVNFLRVLATMCVFILHGRSYVENLSNSHFLNTITNLPAWAGVWIFLFLSGYTVGLGFFKGRYPLISDNNAFSLKKLLQFYWGRFLKIAPYYYIYCLLWDLFNEKFYFLHDPMLLLRVLTFSFNGNGGKNGMGHLWYVSTAMQMYLIMPFAYLLIRKLKTPIQIWISFIFTLISGLILRLYLEATGADWYTDVYTHFVCNIDLVVCGMLIAYYKMLFAPKPHANKMLIGASFLLLIALVGYNVSIYVESTTRCLLIYRYYLPSCYVLILSVLILYWGDLDYRPVPVSFKAFLHNPLCIVDWFSAKTYCFYIFHIAALTYTSAAMKEISILTKLPTHLSIITQFGLAFLLSLFCSNIFLKIKFKSGHRKAVSSVIISKEVNNEA